MSDKGLKHARSGDAPIEYGLSPSQFDGIITQTTVGPKVGNYDEALTIGGKELTKKELHAIAKTFGVNQ